MILPLPQDAIHRSMLYRLLMEIADNGYLADALIFKGGTCAALLGFLDRFSVDLDFNHIKDASPQKIRKELVKIFRNLNLEIKGQSVKTVQYTLRYPAKFGQRNTLKIDVLKRPYTSDINKPAFLSEIDRYLVCQTRETMFSHKMAAVMDRYQKHGSIAGRDIYDLYYFFISGYEYDKKIIKERTGLNIKEFLSKLRDFISQKVTIAVINEDLNVLLTNEKFQAVRKSLKQEVINLLENEIKKYKEVCKKE